MRHALSDSSEKPKHQPSGDNRKIWIAIVIQLVWMIFMAGGLMLAVSFFPVSDYLLSAQRKVTGIEVWGAILHSLLFALCNVLLLPGGILAVGGGLFFGLWTGWFFNVVGSVLGAAISFLLSRKFGRIGLINRLLNQDRWKQLENSVQEEGWKIVFFSQLHPLFPTSLLNYLYGLAPIRASTCLFWIALGQAPGLFLYAYIGTMAQRGIGAWKGDKFISSEDWLAWVTGLLLAIGILIILGRLSLRIIRESGGGNEVNDSE